MPFTCPKWTHRHFAQIEMLIGILPMPISMAACGATQTTGLLISLFLSVNYGKHDRQGYLSSIIICFIRGFHIRMLSLNTKQKTQIRGLVPLTLLLAIQSRWELRLVVIPLLAIRSQQFITYATTAQLTCHVQNFVAITLLESWWEWNKISIEFELRWQNR